MSIINQMLQKLEQRRSGLDSSLPDGVRAVSRISDGKTRRGLLMGVITAVVVVGGGYYSWLWWQQRAIPVKSVAVAGKIPGAEVQAKAPVSQPLPKPEEVQDLNELAEAARESYAKPPAVATQKNVQKKKKEISQDQLVGRAGKGEQDEVVSLSSNEPLTSYAKRPSRESSGKIRMVREEEQSMKSVTPQQMALSHYQKALSLLQQGRVAEARSGLEEVLKLDSYHLAARQVLAGVLVDQRQFNQAELLLQEGVNLNPEQYGFAMALARLQVERGDVRSALDTLYKGLPHAGDKADYLAFLAALLQRSEQHKKAIEYYQAALRLAPSGSWQMGLGISLQAEHRMGEAQEAFGRAKASNDLTPDLSLFVDQRLRMVKKVLQNQATSDIK